MIIYMLRTDAIKHTTPVLISAAARGVIVGHFSISSVHDASMFFAWQILHEHAQLFPNG